MTEMAAVGVKEPAAPAPKAKSGASLGAPGGATLGAPKAKSRAGRSIACFCPSSNSRCHYFTFYHKG